MTRILVCGGRDYDHRVNMFRALDKFNAERPVSLVIQGGADGADRYASEWALRLGIPCDQYDADWRSHGHAAGPIRNARMLRDGKPDVVIAFPGGRGTANMVRQARERGVEVIEVA